ncbi:hypothetical protein FHX58_004213 [Paraburkholderia tropica]|nr:hypothetical protein [Paraburkholderia tropica]
MKIGALHEQRPLTRFRRGQFVGAERAVFERPALAEMRDEARFDVVAVGKREQLVA